MSVGIRARVADPSKQHRWEEQMHMSGAWGMGWMWFAGIGIVVALVAVIGWALTWNARRGKRDTCPEGELQRHYEKGEISAKQLERRREILERGPSEAGEGVEAAVDPICGMTVRKDRAVATVRHEDRTYHFCSRQCRDRFEEAPEAVV